MPKFFNSGVLSRPTSPGTASDVLSGKAFLKDRPKTQEKVSMNGLAVAKKLLEPRIRARITAFDLKN